MATVKELQAIVNAHGVDAFNSVAGCIKYGWYDWFCYDGSLKNRTKKFLPILKGLKEGGKVDFGYEVCFKNNCPLVGSTYDDMRISSECENVFVISHKDPCGNGKTWTVWVPDNGYQAPFKGFDNVRQLIKWLNEK